MSNSSYIYIFKKLWFLYLPILFSNFSVYFAKKEGLACKNQADVFGNYGNLDDAKKACDANPNCGKVCDKYCNGVTSTLCVKGSDEIESLAADSTGACLFAHDRDSKHLKNFD